MIDAFAESQGISMNTVHCKATFGQGLYLGPSFFVFRYFYCLFSLLMDAWLIYLRFCWQCPCTPCKATDLHESERWICKLLRHTSWSIWKVSLSLYMFASICTCISWRLLLGVSWSYKGKALILVFHEAFYLVYLGVIRAIHWSNIFDSRKFSSLPPTLSKLKKGKKIFFQFSNKNCL